MMSFQQYTISLPHIIQIYYIRSTFGPDRTGGIGLVLATDISRTGYLSVLTLYY